jgi:hypothetical protein
VSAENEILLSVNTCKNDEAHNVENLTAINAIQEEEIVEPIADFSLSQDELHVVSCDKEKLYVDASFTSTPQVVNKNDTFCLDPYNCAEANLFHPNTCAQDEQKLMSSLNTLGYIEFDILCDLKCLEEKLFAYSGFSYLSNHTSYFISKYNCKGQYLVHKIYICSNMKYPFRLQYDQIGGCINTTNILQSPSSFSL